MFGSGWNDRSNEQVRASGLPPRKMLNSRCSQVTHRLRSSPDAGQRPRQAEPTRSWRRNTPSRGNTNPISNAVRSSTVVSNTDRKNVETTQNRQPASVANASPQSVSATPRYGSYSTSPRSSSFDTISVTLAGATFNYARSSPVATRSTSGPERSEIAKRYRAALRSGSDSERERDDDVSISDSKTIALSSALIPEHVAPNPFVRRRENEPRRYPVLRVTHRPAVGVYRTRGTPHR